MNELINWLFVFLCLALLPGITIGIIRKTRALLQNRIGAPLWQHFMDIWKLLQKWQTVSEDASWLFRAAPALNLSALLAIACLSPWVSFKPATAADDLFLLIYLFAVIRFFTILASLDTGSSFGAFGASREATLSVLVEPGVILALTAVALTGQTSNLSLVFGSTGTNSLALAPVWLLSGAGLFLLSLVELSRSPVDDPTTHLELTMIHEAMILENSGPNLALIEFGTALRLVILYGLSSQCFLHALKCRLSIEATTGGILSIIFIFVLALITAVIETVSVKLKWTRVPEFIAYGISMSFLAVLVALAGRV